MSARSSAAAAFARCACSSRTCLQRRLEGCIGLFQMPSAASGSRPPSGAGRLGGGFTAASAVATSGPAAAAAAAPVSAAPPGRLGLGDVALRLRDGRVDPAPRLGQIFADAADRVEEGLGLSRPPLGRQSAYRRLA